MRSSLQKNDLPADEKKEGKTIAPKRRIIPAVKAPNPNGNKGKKATESFFV